VNPIVDAALALALQSSAVEASRIEVVGTPVEQTIANMRAELAPKFQQLWDLAEPRKYMRMARRVGKSHHCIREQAAAAALGNAASMNPYILPTHKSARLVVWPLMKKIIARHFPEAIVNETMTTITLPVGGTLVVGGCETLSDVGRWYGMAFEMAVVDERGNFPDAVLVELDDEALEPSLMDFGGRFIGAGNPGRILRGRWYDQTRDGLRSDPTPLYVGDARENPFLGQPAAAYFEQVKKRHGWTDATATFRRQYLGEWVEDAEGLVFPLTAANMCDGLPARSLAGGVLPKELWRYTIGVDVGYVDKTAIAVLAAHPLDNREFLIRTEQKSGMLPRDLGARLRELQREYPRAPIVMDTGGMGKVHAEECTRIFGLHIIPAEKRDKASAVRILRDDIRSARFQVDAGPLCDPFREQCAALGWDEDGHNPEEGLPDDVIHAVYYPHRYQRHYTSEGAAPVDDSPEARQRRDYEALRLAAQRRVMGGTKNGRAAWDR